MAGRLMEQEAGAVHEPVMHARITELLAVGVEDAIGPSVIVDATIGLGGHATRLVAASRADVHLVGFDRDESALAVAERRLVAYRGRTTLLHCSFDELARQVRPLTAEHGPVAAVLYDLGVSSLQLDRAERGFSFRRDGPLDMRMDATSRRTAADLVNTLSENELARLLRDYGEERHARRIAAAIRRRRPLHRTAELAEVVAAAVPAPARHGGVHPATRTFQALRIAVNDELEGLRASLPQALELAAPAPVGGQHTGRGGRVAVLAYHSLEDRIAKRVFTDAARACVCPPDLPVCGCGRRPLVRALTRGAERPSAAEVAANPRARSARLRAVERTAEPFTQGAP